MSDILVIAAHPDDEVLGAGGTIYRRSDEGDNVFALSLGDGISSRYSSLEDAPQSEIDLRKEHARQAGEVLGIESHFFCDFPDNRFDSVDLLDLIKEIETVAEEIKPDIVYTHHSGDLNLDHRRTHQAVMTAFRPTPGSCVKKIYSFEVLSSTEWNSDSSQGTFRPNVFVDIKESLSKKIEAMKCYAKELQEYPQPRSEKAIRALAKRRGSQSGLEIAEAFQIKREIVD